MSESTCKKGLVRALRTSLPFSVVIPHTEQYHYGVPDVSVTWAGKTTWLEIKFLNPRLKTRGVQHLRMQELERAGSAYYVLYNAKFDRVDVVRPRDLLKKEFDPSECVTVASGKGHKTVVDFIRRLHTNDNHRP